MTPTFAAAAAPAGGTARDDGRVRTTHPGPGVSDASLSTALPERILVRLPTWVGDVIMATPVLRALRETWPRAEIVVEGRPALRQLVDGLPTFDRFVPDPGRGAGAVLRRARGLRALACDWAILLPDSARAALAPALARIPLRIGYAREPLRRWLLTHPLAPPMQDGRRAALSMVERYLRIVRPLGCAEPPPGLDLWLAPKAVESAARRLARAGVAPGERLLIVTPGAAYGSSKLWPPASFAAACRALATRHGLRTVLAPGPGEEPIAAAIATETPDAVVLADPPTSLAELVALVDAAALLLTNDTGPRHMAVARGTPVVALLGPTDPRHTAHLLDRQRVLREDVPCSPCHQKVCPIDHRCMTRLAPERVVAAAAELLGEPRRG
jgi:heptosyltransferase-2